ncbi:MAG TPA: dehypoxanthine futalosine cyclase, partial [Acidobacteriaceae bacterium]|nr:dehypoxanthine futalosine cyclase [Acidobacteriaceae bacterium]
MGITRQQALNCFDSDDLVGIGMEADAVRRQLHPEGVVGYAIEAQIDCSNLADAVPNPALEGLHRSIAEAREQGAGCIRLMGCTHMEPEQIEHLLRGMRQRFPAMWMEALSAMEISSFAATNGLSLRDTLARLIDAGLDSIADDGLPLPSRQPGSSP